MKNLEKFLTENSGKPILIFKFSPICGISRSVEEDFDQFISENEEFPYLKVDVINERPLSAGIAQKFGIRHESPQLIVLDEDHQMQKHASHYEISDLLKNILD